jgi:biopolymer transport protein TolR
MTPTRTKRRRQSRRGGSDGHLSLVPFIDMLTILVVFLLLHTADVDILPNTRNISIPQSVSELKPRETLVVMVTKDMLYVDGKPVVSVADVLASSSSVVAPLRLALATQSARLVKTGDAAQPANREVTIMGDRDTSYAVLKKVMATCTDAEYAKVSLAVLERERAA